MEEKHTVLIAEDGAVNRSILRRILSQDYNLLEAEDGTRALEIIEKRHSELDAVIMDLRMPGKSGEELLRIISADERYKDLPVLVATGESESGIERSCLKLGAWDFVSKPYDSQIIQLRLRNIIGRREGTLMRRIRMLSQRDKLTGLYNRDYFTEMTCKMIENNPDVKFALVRMDINRFRLFTATFGREESNALICRVAKRLADYMTEFSPCTYGRFESDIFCACVPDTGKLLEKRMLEAAKRAHGLCDNYRIDLAFGVYRMSDAEINVDRAYSLASEASRKCKDGTGNIYAFYDESMYINQMNIQRINSEMERALEEEQFVIYLQPKYSLMTDKPHGAEALVRWRHPERGMIAPGEFIPVFEQNGFITQLDHYVWEHVCRLLSRWSSQGLSPEPVSVNISRISLYNPNIADDLALLVKRYGLTPELLNLEITESAYMSNPAIMKSVIDSLRRNGFIIMMDDFGSSYSSLNTLKDIEMNILKIDMKFLPSGKDNVKSEKILASITRMAHWLGMPVIAEGVETKEQKDFLVSIGCGYVQGYYFARPMPAEQYEMQILRRRDDTIPGEEHEINISELDSLWSADTRISALLKSVAVPFALLENSRTGSDVIRMNSAYIHTFGEGRRGVNELSVIERKKLSDAMEAAIAGNGVAECECLYIHEGGEMRWYRIHLQLISGIAHTTLFGATFMDITDTKRMKRELSDIFRTKDTPLRRKDGILIAGETEESTAALAALFGSEFSVTSAAGGEAGLEALANEPEAQAVILVEAGEGGMTAGEFIARKNEIPNAAGIPVVVISRESDAETQSGILKSGAGDCVVEPYTNESLVRRVRNVAEHSIKFRAMMREYREANLLRRIGGGQLDEDTFSPSDICDMVSFMHRIFDIVRIVNPEKMTVLETYADGTIEESPYSCYKVWGKDCRCENCSSICARNSKHMLSKYEFIKNDIFYVISQPVNITGNDGEKISCVMEIVSHISDHIAMQENSSQSIERRLEDTFRKIYTDTLTGVYNRRYYDEMQFFTRSRVVIPRSIGIIFLDMRHFKMINDTWGHAEGDRILAEVAAELQKQVRGDDAVIRYGGDEFVIILADIDREQITQTVERLRKAISRVRYGELGEYSAEADFGSAYNDGFERDHALLDRLFSEADDMMYLHKKAHTKEAEKAQE